MTSTVEKNDGHHATSDAAEVFAERTMLLHYTVARYYNNGVDLLKVPLKSGGEALPVFSYGSAAQDYVSSTALGPEWCVRISSPGELLSLLVGCHAGVEWVLLDPLAGCVAKEEPAAKLVRWEGFVDSLLGE